jgi:hypothetical protein
MSCRVPMAILIIVLASTWGSIGAHAGPSLPYRLDKAEQGFWDPAEAKPTAARAASDALIGRPLGLAATVAGAGVFVATLPFTIPSRSVRLAGWELVGRQGGWTFNRPLGTSAPQYERVGIFNK